MIPYKRLSVGIFFGLLFFVLYRSYINYHAFTVGLDYFEQEFHTFYMTLLYAQLAIISTAGALLLLYIWFTRPKECTMTPVEELSIYQMIFGIFAASGVFAVIILGIYTEADAAWHQVTVRDTDFTPTHIALFYMAIPIGLAAMVAGGLWIHTRMPDFRNRVSVPLLILISAPILIMPNLGFNEWGHTFFYAEELFAAPIHWGFVVLGWGLFGMTGFLIQCIARVKVLTDMI
jgi:methane/ammonia monooxygenase subunit C